MLDTIVLVLNQNMIAQIDHDKFEPSTRGLFDGSYGMGARGYLTCKQNVTKSELKAGIYKPYITVTKRIYEGAYQIMMKIQFSAPKLIYKNNFDELEDGDFDLVVDTLQAKLKGMGVLIFREILLNTYVSTIHYSKNIELAGGLIPFTIIKDLQKSNISQRLDFNQTDYRNEGHSFKYRANSFEVAFYDKVKDMQRAKISDSRAEEKENLLQMKIFDDIQQHKKEKTFEVMRMEVRLNKRQKIRQSMKLINEECEPTFRNLFRKQMARKILFYFLDEMESKYPKTLYFQPKSNKDFIAQFMIDNPKAKLKDTILAFGFQKTLEEMNTREVKELLKNYPLSTWYRFIKEMNSYSYSKNAFNPFKPIRDCIEQFKPLKLVDFQAKMLNNDKDD